MSTIMSELTEQHYQDCLSEIAGDTACTLKRPLTFLTQAVWALLQRTANGCGTPSSLREWMAYLVRYAAWPTAAVMIVLLLTGRGDMVLNLIKAIRG